MMAPDLSVLMARGQSRSEEVSLGAVRTGPSPPALTAVNLSDLNDHLEAEVNVIRC